MGTNPAVQHSRSPQITSCTRHGNTRCLAERVRNLEQQQGSQRTLVKGSGSLILQDAQAEGDHCWPAARACTDHMSGSPSESAVGNLQSWAVTSTTTKDLSHLDVRTMSRVPTTSALEGPLLRPCRMHQIMRPKLATTRVWHDADGPHKYGVRHPTQRRQSCSSSQPRPAGEPMQVAAKPAATADVRCTGSPSS